MAIMKIENKIVYDDLVAYSSNKAENVRSYENGFRNGYDHAIDDVIINSINKMITRGDIKTDDISDGYHTFGQLYYQRMMLFATIVNLFPELSWKTTKHEDGEDCFGGGWFLVTIDTPKGAYGYHYRMKDWDKFNCQILDKAKHWDGYTEADVDRLFSLFRELIKE